MSATSSLIWSSPSLLPSWITCRASQASFVDSEVAMSLNCLESTPNWIGLRGIQLLVVDLSFSLVHSYLVLTTVFPLSSILVGGHHPVNTDL